MPPQSPISTSVDCLGSEDGWDTRGGKGDDKLVGDNLEVGQQREVSFPVGGILEDVFPEGAPLEDDCLVGGFPVVESLVVVSLVVGHQV